MMTPQEYGQYHEDLPSLFPRKIPDPRLRPKLDRNGLPQYRHARNSNGQSPLELEYLAERGLWAPERRSLRRLLFEGTLDPRNGRLLALLQERRVSLPENFGSDAEVCHEVFREIGGRVVARVLNVIFGNEPDDLGIISRSGWHNLGFVIDRAPKVSFIEADREIPLRVDEALRARMNVNGVHRAIEERLRSVGVMLNGVPYGLRVFANDRKEREIK